jgi:hypothetical protein
MHIFRKLVLDSSDIITNYGAGVAQSVWRLGWLHLQGEDGGSKVLRNVGILPHHYTVSQPSEDGGSKVLRNVGILPQHYMVSQPSEDGGSKVLRNVGILPQHYMVSQPSEDGGSKVLRNVGILPQHYTVLQPRRRRLEFLDLWCSHEIVWAVKS